MPVVTRLLAGVLLAGLIAAAPAGAKARDLYAFRYGAATNLLLPYDPVRLVQSGPGIRLGRYGHAWSTSPDRTRLVAAAGVRRPGETASLRLVDLESGRVEGTLGLAGELRRVSATAWVQGRVLAVVGGADAVTVYAVDPNRRTVVAKVEIPGLLVSGERTAARLVLLLAPVEGIGPATLAVVDQTLRVRTVVLDGIRTGTTATGEGSTRRVTVRRPGTAVAPSGLRLYVFGGGEPAVRVDLRTLDVAYSPLRSTAAARKRVEGSVREADALPDGRIVVHGFDHGSRRPVPVTLVDPRSWSRRVLDPSGALVAVEAGLIFLRGERGFGLRMRRPSGEVVQLFRTGTVAAVHVVGPRALVTFHGSGVTAAVVELGTGRVVRRTVPARPVLGAGQAIVG